MLVFFRRCRACRSFRYFLAAVSLLFITIIGAIHCGFAQNKISVLDGENTSSSDTGVTFQDSLASQDLDTAEVDEDSVAEDPGDLIESARTLCTEGDFAAADSNLKKAVQAIEAIDEESDSEWFPASRYVDEIVSIYSEKMPAEYSLPDEIALTAFQRQMVRSLDSMKILPAESLSIATMGCRKNLVYDVPMVWNDRVQRAVFYYVNNRKNTIDRWFPRTSYYIPFMRKMFADSGLPQDLAYLPLIESGFNPLAYSYAHASGIWQFISSTGNRYGLRHTYWLDERRDPIRSTAAAVMYLRKLYGDFRQWHLALAAYNCGENGVSRSIARSQNNDFWKLKYLPAQTRNYVPCFLAALTIAKNPACFGVVASTIDTFSLDTVFVSDCIIMNDIAQAVGVTPDSLKKMNPHILHWCTPPDATNTILYLPQGKKQAFNGFCEQLPAEKKVKWCRYQVKGNDSMLKLARQFGISADGIKSINRLKNDRLAEGQCLFLPLASSPAATETAYYIPPELPKDDDGYGFMTRYRVRRGDCISKIARKFHVTCSQLYRWNHLSSSSKLRPGRCLIVRPYQPPGGPAIAIASPSMVKRGSSYVVQMGDTPFSIARRSGVPIRDLLAWNDIDATQPIIHVGDTIKLTASEKNNIQDNEQISATVPSGVSSGVSSGTSATGLWQDTGWTDDWSTVLAPREAAAGAQNDKRLYTADTTAHNDTSGASANSGNTVLYKVRDGDTLQRIAAAFGITVEQLFKDNGLKADSAIVPGEIIKVNKPAGR